MEDDKKKQGQSGYGDFLKDHQASTESSQQNQSDDNKKKQNQENQN